MCWMQEKWAERKIKSLIRGLGLSENMTLPVSSGEILPAVIQGKKNQWSILTIWSKPTEDLL